MINLGNLFKTLGCIFILVSSVGIGFSMSKELEKHLDELEKIKHIFSLMRSEMQYSRVPFAEVFEKIGIKMNGIYGNWLCKLSTKLEEKEGGTFEEQWSQSIDEMLKQSALKKDEKNELKSMGKNLEYIESLDIYIEQLEYSIKQTRESNQSKKKICKSMSITGGMFLVILLI